MPDSRSAWLGVALAVLIALMALAMAALGFWQLNRLAERRAWVAETRARLDAPPIDLSAQPTADLPEYQPVRLRGVYDFAHEIVLRNRAHLSSPGVHLLTPLRLVGGQAVLIDRGWIPFTLSEPVSRSVFHAPVGEVTLDGIVHPAQSRPYAFLPADPLVGPGLPRLDAWFWVDIPQIEQQLPYDLPPFYVEANPDLDANQLPVAAPHIDLDEGSHLGYAIQWFSFSAILVIGSLSLRRQRRRQNAA